MKTITKKITLHSFDELIEDAQKRAMADLISWYTSINWTGEEFIPDFVQKAIDKCEQLKTPWFFDNYVLEYGEPDLLIELDDAGEVFLTTGEHYY